MPLTLASGGAYRLRVGQRTVENRSRVSVSLLYGVEWTTDRGRGNVLSVKSCDHQRHVRHAERARFEDPRGQEGARNPSLRQPLNRPGPFRLIRHGRYDRSAEFQDLDPQRRRDDDLGRHAPLGSQADRTRRQRFASRPRLPAGPQRLRRTASRSAGTARILPLKPPIRRTGRRTLPTSRRRACGATTASRSRGRRHLIRKYRIRWR